jgi:glycosyltransferase involved in cell wall biosynthesis
MKEKLKICHIITRMIVGGAQENTLLTILDHLNKGHEVILITGPSPGPEGELLKNKEIPEFKTVINKHLIRNISPMSDMYAYLSLKKFLKEQKPDVVHTHSSKAGIIGRAAAWNAKVPFVCHTVHGQAFHRYEKAWKNFLYKSSERWAAKRCHQIYAVANAMIEQCLAAKIAPADKYKTVYSGMELEDFLNSKPDCELRRKLQIPEKVPVVVTVARLFEFKGYEYLLEAAEEISKQFPETHFLIVGDGILMETVREKAAQKGLKFVFAGLVPPSEVCRYIALSDFMIHLSLREGLPRAIVQSLASGKPAIGFNLDGTPEVILHGKTGFIAEPENSSQVAEFAIRFLNDRNLCIRAGKSGQELVKDQFGWQKMGNILEKEYLKGVNNSCR